MTSTASTVGALEVPLERVRVPDNVRTLDEQHVDALAGSIALRGQLVPAIVRPDGERFMLVAGFHRYAALKKLGRERISVEVRDAEGEQTDRAVENIARKQLNPYEEALAVKDALDHGLSEDGAAQALGWPKARVTARVKLLELPEHGQQLVGQGVIPLAAVEQLRTIAGVSTELCEAVVEHAAQEGDWIADRLVSEPSWAIREAVRQAGGKTFVASLDRLDAYDIRELRLGKKSEQLLEEAERLHKQIDRYSYGPPPIRFSEDDIDQARAAGVLIEFEHGTPMIVDRPLYRQLAKQAIKRAVEELRDKAANAAQEKQQARRADRVTDPVSEARRERDQRLRGLSEQAHGVNLDLGTGLLNGLSVVDPADVDVARFFAYGLLGSDHDSSPYTQTGERVARLAVSGIRLVIDEFRADVTKTRKDGSPGRLRIDYGDPKQPETPIAWLWRFIDGAKSAGELYGRALVVIAAEQYASRLVVPQSQRTHPTGWSSHKDAAARALRKLAGPHLPASLKQLENAVKRAHREYEQAEQQVRRQRDAGRSDDTGEEAVAADPNADADVSDYQAADESRAG